MAEQEQQRHWLFVLHTEDRPGVAASVTAAFSGRGITIESFLGYGAVVPMGQITRSLIMITFTAFERRMHMVRRAVQRLAVVEEVRVYDYENEPALIKSVTANVQASRPEVADLLADLDLSLSVADVADGTLSLTAHARPAAVDMAVRRLQDSGWLVSCVYAVLPPVQ